MRILWVHNFNPKIKNSGVFMHQSLAFLKENYQDLTIDELYLGNLRNPLIVFYSILRIIFLGMKYDIVHAQYGSMCGFVSSFAFCRKYLTLRGSDWYAKKKIDNFSYLHNKLQNILTRLTLNRYNCIVVVSNRMKEEVCKIYNKKIIVVPSPVDLNKFYPMDRGVCRKKLSLPLNEKLILFPVMNLNNIVKRPYLIKELKTRLPSDVKIINASGIPHHEMVFLYNAVDAVILPSMYEGWPNVIKESLLCNTPFIATDVSDLLEISKRNDSCKIVEPTLDSILPVIKGITGIKDENLRVEVSWMELDNLNKLMVKELYS